MKSSLLKHLKGLNQAVGWMTKNRREVQSASEVKQDPVEAAVEIEVPSPDVDLVEETPRDSVQNIEVLATDASEKTLAEPTEADSPQTIESVDPTTEAQNSEGEPENLIAAQSVDEFSSLSAPDASTLPSNHDANNIESDSSSDSSEMSEALMAEHLLPKTLSQLAPLQSEPDKSEQDKILDEPSNDEASKSELDDVSECSEIELEPTSLELQLRNGICVAIEELQHDQQGWLYRGIPVMVFGVDVEACEDLDVRSEFKRKIHLLSCCHALDQHTQLVWVGTDVHQLQSEDLHSPLDLCDACLTQLNYYGYSHLDRDDQREIKSDFDFQRFTALYSTEYFKDGPDRYWNELGGVEVCSDDFLSGKDCQICGYQSTKPGHILSKEYTNNRGEVCIPCAHRSVDTPLLISSERANEIYPSRLKQLSAPVESWEQLRQHLKHAWHGLSYHLQVQGLDLPELYRAIDVGHQNSDIESTVVETLVATLYWEDSHRGIVDEFQKSVAPDIEGVDIWAMQEVLKNFQ